MTPEQKRKVPRHLRGAGVRRFWCPHCDSYHSHSPVFCKNNPDYEENRRKQAEGASRVAKERWHAGHGKVVAEGNRRRWELKSERTKAAEVMARTNRKMAKQGKKSGKNNPFYGRKHSLKTRLKMSVSRSVLVRPVTEKQMRDVPIPMVGLPPGFGQLPPVERDEFSGGSVVDVWTDEFDPFH